MDPYWDAYSNAFNAGQARNEALNAFITKRRNREIGNALGSGDYAGAAKSAYGAGDLQTGMTIQNAGREQEKAKLEQRVTALGKATDALLSMPEQQRGQYLQSAVIPMLGQLGFNDPQMVQQLQSADLSDRSLATFRAMLGEKERELKFMAAGSSVFVLDPATGRQVKRYEGTKYMNVPQGGTLVELGDNEPEAPGQTPLDIIADEAPNAAVTSTIRTPDRNQRVGGVPNSRHLSGNAIDLTPEPGETTAQLAARLKRRGLEAIDEGDHVHVEWGDGQTEGGAKVVARGATKPQDPLKDLQAENIRSQIAEREAKVADKVQRREQAVESARAKAQWVSATVDEAIGMIGETLGLSGEAGFVGKTMSNVPGTKAYNLARTIETIKANLGFDALQEMRANSPTGGALGQVAVQELVALQAAVTNLDVGQTDEQLKANLNKVKTHYARWLNAVSGAGGGAPAGSVSALPPQAAQQLKPGKVTTFANGQSWTLRNGKPVQVK